MAITTADSLPKVAARLKGKPTTRKGAISKRLIAFFMASTTEEFEIDGLVQQRKELEALMMNNPQMEKRVQELIRKVLMQVRKDVGNAAKSAMKSDPRQAYKAVRSAVYKRILGGNVNILSKRRASNVGGGYVPTRTLRTGQRGGNRRVRSARTDQVDGYMGSDRGFILRFLNAGTADRKTVYGNRGRIAARNFFSDNSQREMEQAAQQLGEMIDELIKKEISS